MTHPDEPEQVWTRSQTFRLADLVDDDGWIRDWAFYECTFEGPAVLHAVADCTIESCMLHGSAPGTAGYIIGTPRAGMIPMERVYFLACRFENVSVSQPA